ncbi:MAG: diaminopimelate epimerase [Acidiferrobacterales bacterium]|nr:diaminopimelate epimerase [Acidiferrobacterales bacterium]
MFNFTKMHSFGNDFVIIVGDDGLTGLTPARAKSIANRNSGIGCDQILLVIPICTEKNVFKFRIYNTDGSQAAQCGNGARCVARFLYDRGLANDEDIILRTHADDIRCKINDESTVTVSLGVPNFVPSEIPFVADTIADTYELEVKGTLQTASVLSIGNPHAVIVVSDVESAPVSELGGPIEFHPRFPQRTNVGFMEVESSDSIRLRVHERGVGETRACGSGACAAVIAGQRLGLLDESVTVNVEAGQLFVEWHGEGEPVLLTGPTTYVFEGRLLD